MKNGDSTEQAKNGGHSPFNMLDALDNLKKAGMPNEHAEAVVRLQYGLIESHLATKRDIAETKRDIAELKEATKRDIAELRKAGKDGLGIGQVGTQEVRQRSKLENHPLDGRVVGIVRDHSQVRSSGGGDNDNPPPRRRGEGGARH